MNRKLNTRKAVTWPLLCVFSLFLIIDYTRTSVEYMHIWSWMSEYQHSDKVLHFVRSFLLSWATFFVLCVTERLQVLKRIIFVLLVFLTALEVSQIYFVSRQFSLFDLLLDFVGVLFGFLLIKVLLLRNFDESNSIKKNRNQ
jgi:hypothetical protein